MGKVAEHDTLELRLTDVRGNEWAVGPFYPFQQQRKLEPVTPVEDILQSLDDGDDDHDEDDV